MAIGDALRDSSVWHRRCADVVDSLFAQAAPVGGGALWFTATPPLGWLICNGQAISRTDYAALFTAIGTTFGVGDGSTTFNVPDFRGRFPFGVAASGTGSTLGGTFGAIDHTHSVPAHNHGMGAGADLNITASGSHSHNVVTPGPGANARLVNDANGSGGNAAGFTVAATHTHTAGNFAGRIGLVTGGVDGNAAMTSGAANPPGLAIHVIIKF